MNKLYFLLLLFLLPLTLLSQRDSSSVAGRGFIVNIGFTQSRIIGEHSVTDGVGDAISAEIGMNFYGDALWTRVSGTYTDLPYTNADIEDTYRVSSARIMVGLHKNILYGGLGGNLTFTSLRDKLTPGLTALIGLNVPVSKHVHVPVEISTTYWDESPLSFDNRELLLTDIKIGIEFRF